MNRLTDDDDGRFPVTSLTRFLPLRDVLTWRPLVEVTGRGETVSHWSMQGFRGEASSLTPNDDVLIVSGAAVDSMSLRGSTAC